MIVKKCFLNVIKYLVVFITLGSFVCVLSGCMWLLDEKPRDINGMIKSQGKKYEDIYELTCDLGDDASISSKHFELLGKLVNLEKIKFVGIASDDDAQRFFSKLSELKKLHTVEIVDSSHVEKIDKLGDIENLKNLSIIGRRYGGTKSYVIKDLDLLYKDSRFRKIESLTLKHVKTDRLPNLTRLTGLKKLSISGDKIKELDEDAVNWEQLETLELYDSDISSIDKSIVSRLTNLQTLDISYSKITDVSFVLDLPKLKNFKCLRHNKRGIDVTCLRKHPNYNKNWDAE